MIMERLNQNNFLLWDGEFNEAEFDVIANDDTVNELPLPSSNGIYASIFPLENDEATFGINFASFELLSGDNEEKPYFWDPVTGELRRYLPEDYGFLSDPVIMTYRFKDLQGNLSNIATITYTAPAIEI